MDRLNPRIALEGYSRMKGRQFATPVSVKAVNDSWAILQRGLAVN